MGAMAKSTEKNSDESRGERVICRNRKAAHEFHIFETLEAGLALTGTEVKSLRCGHASLEDSFARIEDGELWLIKATIPEYPMANVMNHEPKRKRKLLVHRREIVKFAQKAQERGYTIVPLKLYFARGRAKVELALARGRRHYDKREKLKARGAKREMERAMASRRRR
jgi:SsrA-binding protein